MTKLILYSYGSPKHLYGTTVWAWGLHCFFPFLHQFSILTGWLASRTFVISSLGYIYQKGKRNILTSAAVNEACLTISRHTLVKEEIEHNTITNKISRIKWKQRQAVLLYFCYYFYNTHGDGVIHAAELPLPPLRVLFLYKSALWGVISFIQLKKFLNYKRDYI